MRKQIQILIGLLVITLCLGIAYAANRSDESSTVTNSTATYTVASTYHMGTLRAVQVHYERAVAATVTVEQVRGNITNIVVGGSDGTLASQQDLLYLPVGDLSLGPTGTIWRVTCPTTNIATVIISIKD